MISKIKIIYDEYPKKFWVLIGAFFIDQVGGALIFPFLALYITSKYNVGMIEVGKIFAIFSIAGIIGSTIGGAIADKFGRKAAMVFGLIISALANIAIGLSTTIGQVYFIGAIMGIFGNLGGPAAQALMTDLLPEKQRTDGFGVLRVAMNLAVAIGPAIGGLIAEYSFMILFIMDAILSAITAIIVIIAIPETKPGNSLETSFEKSELSLGETLLGYLRVFKDRLFMAYWVSNLLMVVAYMQMNSTLSVYLRDVHQVPEKFFGSMISMNAAMVVVMQFWVTRRVKKFPAMVVMVVGALIYAIGFTMYGFVTTNAMFILAMIIITIAEMIVSPVAQALVAKFSPEDMRGRYMAVFGFSWAISNMTGPLAAGVVMDNYNPNWVWFACGVFLLGSALLYFLIGLTGSDRLRVFDEQQPLSTLPAEEPEAIF
ncbi:MAG: MFS transporter [Anaerolineales bacterium]|nr:MFS transporter [Anaerolineales bacterium]